MNLPLITARDEANALARQNIAERERTFWLQAVAACGLGHQAYGKWILVDRNGGPDVVIFCCRKQGMSGWQPHYRDVAASQGIDLVEVTTFNYNGVPTPCSRWEVRWTWVELYHPKSAEELAALRANRQANKQERDLARWKADNPLLAHLEEEA